MNIGNRSPAPRARGDELPAIARESLARHFHGQPAQLPFVPAGDLAQPSGVFVTLRNRAGDLRGCIGTLAPKYPNLAEETWWMARAAAFRDTRFSVVRADELDDLRFEISVVHPPEAIPDATQLDAARYGVVVSTPDGRRGALLPAIAGIETPAEQLSIARRKGGIGPNEPVRLERFTVEHFEESSPGGPRSGEKIVTRS